MTCRYFYDLPVYRLRRDEYYAAQDEYIEQTLFRPGTPDEPELRQRENSNPRSNFTFRELQVYKVLTEN